MDAGAAVTPKKLSENSQNFGSPLLIPFIGDDIIQADGERNHERKGERNECNATNPDQRLRTEKRNG